MANQMTYAEAINIALNVLGDTNPEATDRLKALNEQLAKRNGSKGMTKTQKENLALKDKILAFLEDEERFVPMAEIQAVEDFEGLSSQKLGALLGQLANPEKDGRVVKNVYKKRTFYAVKGVEWVAPAEPTEDEAE